jgi:hypothetical protein
MIVSIPITSGDDKTFLACIEGLIAIIVAETEPEELYIVRINKWFDHKWLKYSGKGRVAFEYDPKIDTALEVFSQDQLTFPPFNPKQVTVVLGWKRSANGPNENVEKTNQFNKN